MSGIPRDIAWWAAACWMGVEIPTPVQIEREPEEGEDPPDGTGFLRCRGCGWYGSEEATVFTDNARRECAGEHPDASESCPVCHSADLADAYEPAGYA